LVKTPSARKGRLVYGFFGRVQSLFFKQFKKYFCQDVRAKSRQKNYRNMKLIYTGL